jgi:hypothetical protein
MAAKRKVKKLSCPGGHDLPRPGCTPLSCVDKVTSLSRAKAVPPNPEDDEKMTFAVARKGARETLVQVPNLSGADAEEYVEEKKVALLPQAMAEIEFQLKYGDNKERIDAARDVMRMNGMLNRDAPTGVAPTIIINMGDKKLPWQKKEVTVDAQITPTKAG